MHGQWKKKKRRRKKNSFHSYRKIFSLVLFSKWWIILWRMLVSDSGQWCILNILIVSSRFVSQFTMRFVWLLKDKGSCLLCLSPGSVFKAAGDTTSCLRSLNHFSLLPCCRVPILLKMLTPNATYTHDSGVNPGLLKPTVVTWFPLPGLT